MATACCSRAELKSDGAVPALPDVDPARPKGDVSVRFLAGAGVQPFAPVVVHLRMPEDPSDVSAFSTCFGARRQNQVPESDLPK